MPEIAEWARQRLWGVRLEWGSAGAVALGPGSACVVVVDVLSFTTAVSVAVEAGTRVLPYPWRDGGAAEFAARQGAALAVGRRAVSEQPDVAALIRDCASGRELIEGGFAQDVAVATELDRSEVVPVLTDGAFADVGRSPSNGC